MEIPRYWFRLEDTVEVDGEPFELVVWGWSSTSEDEARRMARERVPVVAEAARKRWQENGDGYPYGAHPLREEILRELPGDDGGLAAVLTRNGLGCVVLNTARVLFIDVDLPLRAGCLSLFRRKSEEEIAAATLTRIEEGLAKHPGSFRVYRTAGGFRLLGTDRLYEPGGAESEAIMRDVGADPSFVLLSRVQKSFRARLTPKPFRLQLPQPPRDFPRRNPGGFAEWLARYEEVRPAYATCELIETVGKGWTDAAVAPLVKLHDSMCGVGSGLPLA